MDTNSVFSQVDLRQVMRRWVSGVGLLTTGNRSIQHGMTVNSFTSISVDPPAVTVTLANRTRTKQLLDEVGFFAVHLLQQGLIDLADRFAGRVSETGGRFEGLQIIFGIHDLPIIPCVAAYVECQVIHSYEMENSTLYIGKVLNAYKTPDKLPLVYFDRAYKRILP